MIFSSLGAFDKKSRSRCFSGLKMAMEDTASVVRERLCSRSEPLRALREQGCFFVVIAPNGRDALDAKQLFSLIEGIDPLALVATDKDAIRALEQAYRMGKEV